LLWLRLSIGIKAPDPLPNYPRYLKSPGIIHKWTNEGIFIYFLSFVVTDFHRQFWQWVFFGTGGSKGVLSDVDVDSCNDSKGSDADAVLSGGRSGAHELAWSGLADSLGSGKAPSPDPEKVKTQPCDKSTQKNN
jgi:hypothetical protein